MNRIELEEYQGKLQMSLMSAVGAESCRLLPSGWVCECKLINGKEITIFVNERTEAGFMDRIYTFSEDWMDYIKDLQGSALIAIVQENKPERLHLIDPEAPELSGFSLSHSVDEFGTILYHYTKRDSYLAISKRYESGMGTRSRGEKS